MAYEPIKRGPGRPRKDESSPGRPERDESGPFNPSTPIPRLSPDDDDRPDERHVLPPAPQDPNTDVPMPKGAKAVVTGGDRSKADDPEAAKKREVVDELRERAAKAFMVEGAPVAQAAFEDEDKEPTVPVTLKRDYWPLDGSDRKNAGEPHTMTPAEAEAAQRLGIVDIAIRNLKK